MIGELLAPLFDRSGLQVGARRELEWDLAVAHPPSKVAELHQHLVARPRDDIEVFRDAHPVAQAQCPPIEQSRANRVQAGSLTRVDRDREELAGEVVEGLTVARGEESVFGAGDVEPDGAALTPLNGQPRDLQGPVGVAHRGDQLPDTDVVTCLLRGILALFDAVLHGLDGLLERQPARQMLLGSPPHLAVDDTVGGEILDEFPSDAGESLAGLHDPDGEIERLQVLDERTRIGALRDPVGEIIRRVLGDLEPCLVGKLEDRRRPHTAVEVVVQRHLGELADRHPLQDVVTVLIDRHEGS